MDTRIIPVSEELIAIIAPLSSFTQSVVSGRHLFARGKSACLVEVSVTDRFYVNFQNSQKFLGNWACANSMYQALFSLPTHKTLGTRLGIYIYIYSTKCTEQCMQVIEAWEKHYSTSVHLLASKTWIVRLTSAPEGSGFLAKLQPIHVHHQMWSYSHWDCRASDNKKEEKQ